MLVEEGVAFADVARRLGRSRQWVHKWHARYEKLGVQGLVEHSRAPIHRPHSVSPGVVRHILHLRDEHGWGPKKLLVLLKEQLPPNERVPSRTTIANVLRRNGRVVKRRRRPSLRELYDGRLTEAQAPNDVWAVDFKGEFKLLNGKYCYPLTVTDSSSRLLLGCFALPSTGLEATQTRMNGLFQQYGLPRVIRSDNGTPFASVKSLHALTRLSAGWMAQSIRHERTRPGKPQDNGRHERMHRDLKAHACVHPEANMAAQQRRFDAFIQEFNHVRPHEAHNMRRPAELYVPSKRLYVPSPTFSYKPHFEVRRVYPSGEVTFHKTVVPVTKALGRHWIAFEPIAVRRWAIHFHEYVIGEYDEDAKRVVGLNENREAFVRVKGK